MFISLTTLMKIPLVTTDGKQHQVCSFLFDDRSWTIRFFVADTGRWFTRRQVVIPPMLLTSPIGQRKSLPPTSHIRNWPDEQMSIPLSRYLCNSSSH